MMKYLTLRDKLDYSIPAMISYLLNNFWVFLCWAFGTYLLPVHSVIYIMIFMVVVDFITGVWKALKSNQRLTSKKIGTTIEKTILYMVGIVTSFVLQDHVDIIGFHIMWIFATLIITREYISIIENIEAVTGTKVLEDMKEVIAKVITIVKKPKDDSSREDKESDTK